MNKIEYFKNLLEKNPENPMVHYSLGLEYYKVKDYENAIKHLTKYLQLQEDEGAAYRTLAKCYEEMGEFQKAIEVLKEVHKIKNLDERAGESTLVLLSSVFYTVYFFHKLLYSKG